MSIAGDAHNFGARVVVVNGASGVEYQKPRPVYWERLFFGKDSPLRTIFENDFHGNKIVDFIFNLKIRIDSTTSGRSELVVRKTDESWTDNDFFGLGVLLAYSYLFGLRDLHNENVVPSIKGPQVVDCEIVLVDVILPHETLLLPFKDTGLERSGGSYLIKALPITDEKAFRSLFKGYMAACSAIQNCLEQILGVLAAESQLMQIPVRHILRDTIQYRGWREKRYDIPLLKEEVEQLGRGDIPYFFKFVGSDELYYYSSLNKQEKVNLDNPDLIRAFVRVGMTPSILLDKNKVALKCGQGALYILKIAKPASLRDFSGENFNVTIAPDRTLLEWGELAYST